jgi:hypothetical protein
MKQRLGGLLVLLVVLAVLNGLAYVFHWNVTFW